METFVPPPGLPEDRARAWVHRHRRRARRERRKAAFRRRGAALGVLLAAILCVLALTNLLAAILCVSALTNIPGSTAAPADVEPAPAPMAEPQLVGLTYPVADQAASAAVPPRVVQEVPLEPELQEVLWQACDQHGVPYEVALAVAETESHFDLDADNGSCVGVMQINRVNFDWLREQGVDPATPAGNIQAGVLMLGQHMAAYGDWHKALMAYNCGAGGASKLWAQGYTSSGYSRLVMETAGKWQTILNDKNKEAI